jgi:hypothetical protein
LREDLPRIQESSWVRCVTLLVGELIVVKTLIRVIGLLLAVGGLFAVWLGFEAHDDIRKWENEIIKQESENMSPRRLPGDEGKQKIVASQQQIEKKTMERNLWFGAAVGALIVGGVLVLLPSSGKRKKPVLQAGTNQPEPLDDKQAAGGIIVGGASKGEDSVASPLEARAGEPEVPGSAGGLEPRRDGTGPDGNR